jgi:hypothetical protein
MPRAWMQRDSIRPSEFQLSAGRGRDPHPAPRSVGGCFAPAICSSAFVLRFERSPFEFLDRLADLVPPPRKHRHRYHGVFAPNHKLRRAVTALAIGNVGKRCDATTGGHGGDGHGTGGCCDAKSRRLADRPPTGASSSRLMTSAKRFRCRPTSCPRSTSTASDPSRARGHNKAAWKPDLESLCTDAREMPPQMGGQPFRVQLIGCRKTRHQPHKPLIGSEMPVHMVAEVPLTGLSCGH